MRLILLLGFFFLGGCNSKGTLEGTIFSQNSQSTGGLSCDVISGNTSSAPFTTCGTYDNTNQIVCSCVHNSQRIEEVFFSTVANRDHWRTVYPNINPTFIGESPFSNTGSYHLMMRYSY
ncbi:MAG: hypothetical protein A4S09_00935 [Proteobacteria bacterium SG_bin7]|nr:MAG: hypothetical protein A4S09_00935 [Proteobacteria bacterium SG_bin7]